VETASIISSERLDNILLFHKIDEVLTKSERRGPKGYEAFRYIASAEIIDLEGDIIELNAIAEVMPIMIKQGARTQYNHMNFPVGYFFDWGFTTYKGARAIWIDVEVYDEYPNQKDILRRIKLPVEDKESLTCISLGGFKLEKEKECGNMICWTRITKIEGWEYSHVHRGANQLALNIEEQLDLMEFDSLNKEQPRDSSGKFSPISETVTTTITKYDTSSFNKNYNNKNPSKIPCDEKLQKGEEKDKVKDVKDEDYEKDMDLEAEKQQEEEVIAEAEDEQTEESSEEYPSDEEEFQSPMDLVEDRELLVDMNERVKTIMAAMNIDKSDKEAIDEIKALLDKNLKKKQGEIKMTDNEITVNGKTYVLKPEEKPEIAKSEPEKTVTFSEEQVQALITEELKKFGESIVKPTPEVKVTDTSQNPAQHDENKTQEPDNIFKSMTVEDRFAALNIKNKGKLPAIFVGS